MNGMAALRKRILGPMAKKYRFPKKGLAEAKSKLTFRDFLLPPVRLARSRTPGFHPGNRGSNPLREAIFKTFDQKNSEVCLMPTR